MLYGRNVINDVDEYCMLAAANEEGVSASIQVMIGLPVAPAEITVRF
jgi:hypothetical protein